jgi:hypothetical protein
LEEFDMMVATMQKETNNYNDIKVQNLVNACDDYETKLEVRNKVTYARMIDRTKFMWNNNPTMLGFMDDGGKPFVIDTELGRIYTIVDGELVPDDLKKGEKKKNGLKYLSGFKMDPGINYYEPTGRLVKKEPDLHGIIMLLRDMRTFIKLSCETELDKLVCANHMNSCELDSVYSNLEWCTEGENRAHGNVAKSLRYWYGDRINDKVYKRDEEYNRLKFKLSYKYIEEFDRTYGTKWHGGHGSFTTKKVNKVAEKADVDAFLRFLWSKRYISAELYENCIYGDM